jgi:hypothetical protein
MSNINDRIKLFKKQSFFIGRIKIPKRFSYESALKKDQKKLKTV